MDKKQIQTNNAPAAIGPYSQAIQVGDFTFYSGQIPLDPQSGTIVEGGIVEQTRQVMANMEAMLKASVAVRVSGIWGRRSSGIASRLAL